MDTTNCATKEARLHQASIDRKEAAEMGKIERLMQGEQFEAVVRYAFSADGPLALDLRIYDQVMAVIGRSFTYNSDLINSRDEHFEAAARLIWAELVAADWFRRRNRSRDKSEN